MFKNVDVNSATCFGTIFKHQEWDSTSRPDSFTNLILKAQLENHLNNERGEGKRKEAIIFKIFSISSECIVTIGF